MVITSSTLDTRLVNCCILRLLVLLKPDQTARMGRVSAGAIDRVGDMLQVV
jgi:hypothetical protein